MFDASKLRAGIIIMNIPDKCSWDEMMDSIAAINDRAPRTRYNDGMPCLRLYLDDDDKLRWCRGDADTYNDNMWIGYEKIPYDYFFCDDIEPAMLDELFE